MKLIIAHFKIYLLIFICLPTGSILKAQAPSCNLQTLLQSTDKHGLIKCNGSTMSNEVKDNQNIYTYSISYGQAAIWLSDREYDRTNGMPLVCPKSLQSNFNWNFYRYEENKFDYSRSMLIQTVENELRAAGQKFKEGSAPIYDDGWRRKRYDLVGDGEMDIEVAFNNSLTFGRVEAWDLQCKPSFSTCCNFTGNYLPNGTIVIQPIFNPPPRCVGNTTANTLSYEPTVKFKLIGPKPALSGQASLKVACENGQSMCILSAQPLHFLPKSAKLGELNQNFSWDGKSLQMKFPLDLAEQELVVYDEIGRSLQLPIQLAEVPLQDRRPCPEINKSSIQSKVVCDGDKAKLVVEGRMKVGHCKSFAAAGKAMPECLIDEGNAFKWVGDWESFPDVCQFRLADANGLEQQFSIFKTDILKQYGSNLPNCKSVQQGKSLSLPELFDPCHSEARDGLEPDFYNCMRNNFEALIVLNNDPPLPDATEQAEELRKLLKQRYGFAKVEVLPNPSRGELLEALFDFKDSGQGDKGQKLLYWIGHGGVDGELQLKDAKIFKEDVLSVFRRASSKNVRNFLAIFDICFGTLALDNLHQVDANINWEPGSGGRSYSRKVITSSGTQPSQNIEFTRRFVQLLDRLPESSPWISVDQIITTMKNQGVANPFFLFFDERKEGINDQGSTFFFYHQPAFEK